MRREWDEQPRETEFKLEEAKRLKNRWEDKGVKDGQGDTLQLFMPRTSVKSSGSQTFHPADHLNSKTTIDDN